MLARPALPQDAPCAAGLIATTMDEFGRSLFGSGNAQLLLRTLRELFIRKGNRFSHEFSTLAEIDHRTAGLLLAFPARLQMQAQLKMAGALPAILGWRAALRLLLRALPAAGAREVAGGEFYIAHLATHEDFRRKGVARFLLETAEGLARSAGLTKLSLIVVPENLPAVSLYRGWGFSIAEVVHTRWFEGGLRVSSHYRMVKQFI